LISIEELEERLNPHAAPSFASVATIGEGVYEALEAITRAVLEDFENRMPEHRELVMGQLMVPEGGLADALRQTEEEVPEAKRKPVLHLDFSAASAASDRVSGVKPNLDADEEADSLVAEPGTRPGVGSLEEASVPWVASAALEDSALVPDLTSVRKNESWSVVQGFSLSRMWPHADRELVRAAESSLARCDWECAVTDCGKLVERTLAAVAQVSGEAGLIESPAVCCMLLGVDSRKYLEFQRLLLSVRESCVPSEHEALHAFAFALVVRQARATLISE